MSASLRAAGSLGLHARPSCVAAQTARRAPAVPVGRQRQARRGAALRRSQRAGVASAVVVAAAAGVASADPHLQLATAKLPADVDVGVFSEQLYQWAATLTTNGRNLPFALPLRTDRLPAGFQISLLRVAPGGAVLSVADLVAQVESVAGAGNVLMVRFSEGEGAVAVGLGGAPPPPGASQQQLEQRLDTLLSGLPDVQLIMQTMPDAIRLAVMRAR